MKLHCTAALSGFALLMIGCTGMQPHIEVEYGPPAVEWRDHFDGQLIRFRIRKNAFPDRAVVLQWQAIRKGEKTPFRVCSLPVPATESAYASIGITPLYPPPETPTPIPMRISSDGSYAFTRVELESPITARNQRGPAEGVTSWVPTPPVEPDEKQGELLNIELYFGEGMQAEPDLRFLLRWNVVQITAEARKTT